MGSKCSTSIVSLGISAVALVVAGIGCICPKKADQTSAILGKPDSVDSDERIKKQVLEVIKANPQVVMDTINECMAKKREEGLREVAKNVYTERESIYKQSLKFGKSDSKVTVVAFFDPLCKHCIEFQKNMIKLTKSNKDAAFHLLPVAVLGEDSLTVAKVYIAIYRKSQAKAFEFIEEITKSEKAIDKDAIEKALKGVNMSSKDIEQMMKETDKEIEKNGVLAEKLHIPMVPAIFVLKGTQVQMLQSSAMQPLEEAIDKSN